MLDGNLARQRTHRNSLHRYRKLLDTHLSELERAFVLNQIDEENHALQQLLAETFPLTLPAA
jgi:hypothetical protein